MYATELSDAINIALTQRRLITAALRVAGVLAAFANSGSEVTGSLREGVLD